MGTNLVICVHANWMGWPSANVRLTDLHDIHWLQPAGAPGVVMHGYVLCSDIITGEVPHECARSSAPHRLHVCVLKRHTMSAVYAQLARQADTRPPEGTGTPLES